LYFKNLCQKIKACLIFLLLPTQELRQAQADMARGHIEPVEISAIGLSVNNFE
jgi:hypothetical protein